MVHWGNAETLNVVEALAVPLLQSLSDQPLVLLCVSCSTMPAV